jgi:hypothetical protein
MASAPQTDHESLLFDPQIAILFLRGNDFYVYMGDI